MSRTISAKKKWFFWLQENCIGSSAKGASLSGMRRSWWGTESYVARCCGFLFHLDEHDFNFLKNNL